MSHGMQWGGGCLTMGDGNLFQEPEVGSASESRGLPRYLARELLPATPVDRVRGLETSPFRPAQGPQPEGRPEPGDGGDLTAKDVWS